MHAVQTIHGSLSDALSIRKGDPVQSDNHFSQIYENIIREFSPPISPHSTDQNDIMRSRHTVLSYVFGLKHNKFRH